MRTFRAEPDTTSLGDVARAQSLERDERWRATLRGLDQLGTAELARLSIACDDPRSSGLILDSANYIPQVGWCALAVGLGVAGFLRDHGLVLKSGSQGRAALLEVGRTLHGEFTDNPLSGVRGEAMTTMREHDLRLAVRGLTMVRASDPTYAIAAQGYGDITEALYAATPDQLRSDT